MSSTSLLIKSNYFPDSINLVKDEEAAEYWFECFRELAQKFSVQAAASSNEEDDTAESRSREFLEDFKTRLDEFKQKR